MFPEVDVTEIEVEKKAVEVAYKGKKGYLVIPGPKETDGGGGLRYPGF